MAKHSTRILKLRQEIFDYYDELKSSLPPEQRVHTRRTYYVEQIASKTGYSASHIKQLLTNRYKRKQ